MGSRLDFDSISRADFDDTLAQYPDTVPSKLADLEEQRLTIIPSKLSERKTKGKGHLTKDEVATLVDWKLSHGTFRPSLKGLIQQNSEEFVEETTEAGFSADSLDDSLNTLTKLKGIGPATAALLLSTSEPVKVPFFSDELFRWAFWEDKAGGRWDRKIKYSLKEYRELTARIDALRRRLNVSALEAEKVAYVLGKKGTQLGETVKSPQSPKDTVADAKPPLAKRKATKEPVDDEKPVTQALVKKQKGTTTTFSRRATRSSTKKERSSE